MVDSIGELTVGSARIYEACAEDFMPMLDSESFDLVFSSPPYFNHERYSNEPTQSYVRYDTYDRWRTEFLDRVIQESWRTLKRRGYFLLNVATPRRGYPIYPDALECGLRRFELRGQIQLLMRRVPQKDSNSLEPFKTEPILIFRKR